MPNLFESSVVARIAWLTLAVFALSSCGDDDASDSEGPSGATCPENSSLTYDTFGRAFMEDYCTRCHSSALTGAARNGAPSDHNFDTLEGIKDTETEHLDEEAAAGPDHVNTAMPPEGPKPTEAERRQLGEWLACGTP
jgi:cytochrome c5